MEIQTRVAPAELWLRDDLENIHALLFRFLGFGFPMAMSNVAWHVTQKFVILVPDPIPIAMSNVGWHVTQKFVILVPDPIGFAPWPVLLDSGEPCDICQYTSFRPLIAGLHVAPWNKDDMGDGVPTDRVRPHGPIFPRQLVSHTPTHWITQDALLDMIDAIDADMNARPGDAEQRNCTAYTQPLDRA